MSRLKRSGVIGAAALGLSLLAAPAFAHHTADMIDMEQTVVLSGAVKDFQMTNPIGLLVLDVTGQDGSVTEWAIDLYSPGALSRAGWDATTLSPGDQITTSLHPLKDGMPGGQMLSVERADGTVLFQ